MKVHCHLEVFDDSNIQNQVRSNDFDYKQDHKFPQGHKDFLTRRQGINSFALLLYDISAMMLLLSASPQHPKMKRYSSSYSPSQFPHFFWYSTYHLAPAQAPMLVGSSWGSKPQLGTRIQTLIVPSY